MSRTFETSYLLICLDLGVFFTNYVYTRSLATLLYCPGYTFRLYRSCANVYCRELHYSYPVLETAHLSVASLMDKHIARIRIARPPHSSCGAG